jgi:hypothetical protein
LENIRKNILTFQGDINEKFFVLKKKEDFYSINIKNIEIIEKIFSHLQKTAHTKSIFLKSIILYTIGFTNLISVILQLTSLFTDIAISIEYVQILFLSLFFQIMVIYKILKPGAMLTFALYVVVFKIDELTV